jgi:uncharacterized membrane protein
MISKKQITSTLLVLFLFITAQAQAVSMADTFRSEGKIYVVIGVILLIFAVLFAYLIYLDLRLKRIEKEEKNKS